MKNDVKIHVTLILMKFLIPSSLLYSTSWLQFKAIMAKVLGRETSTDDDVNKIDEVMYTIQVQTIFRNVAGAISSRNRSSPMNLVMSRRDLECACPRLKTNK